MTWTCAGCGVEEVRAMIHIGPVCWECRSSYFGFLRRTGTPVVKDEWQAERDEERATIWGGRRPW